MNPARSFGFPVRDMTGGRRRFQIDYSGAEERFGVTAEDITGNRNAREYAPHHDEFAPGWTVQTRHGRAPDWVPDYLGCVLCGAHVAASDVHECLLSVFVSHS